MESKRKEHLVGQKSYIKGKGLDPRAEYPCIPSRRGIRLPDALTTQLLKYWKKKCSHTKITLKTKLTKLKTYKPWVYAGTNKRPRSRI